MAKDKQELVVLVCGSRAFTYKDAIRDVLTSLDTTPVKLIHGACRGADVLAGEVAIEMGIEVMEMPADWNKDGRAAGPIRNSAMVSRLQWLADLGYRVEVHAFPVGDSRGTFDMIRKTRKAGIPITVHH